MRRLLAESTVSTLGYIVVDDSWYQAWQILQVKDTAIFIHLQKDDFLHP